MSYVANAHCKSSQPQRKRPVDREGQEQKAYFEWLMKSHLRVWAHAFHVPNGGKRTRAEAGLFKAQGVKSGVPDIFIDLPRGAYHGLRIELKATPPNDADVTDSQREWHVRLNAVDYCALICKGLDAAMAATKAYIALPPFDGVSRLNGGGS